MNKNFDPHPFGSLPDGEEIYICTIANKQGTTAKICNFGGVVQSLFVAGKDGVWRDVVQGFDCAQGYRNNKKFIGATIGRYVNVIRDAGFVLNGVRYHLQKNYSIHNLHGGSCGLHNVLWNMKRLSENAVHLSYCSPDGDCGFPGNMMIGLTFCITDDNALEIRYDAACDRDTVAGFTNHSYFNLNGHNSKGFEEHELWIDASYYALNDSEVIPTGEIAKVQGTPFDFTAAKRIGKYIDENNRQLEMCLGYDHNYILNGEGFRKAACLYSPLSGIAMDVLTDMPGLQLYTDNDRSPVTGKDGAVYDGRKAVCLETQNFPDAPNIAHFPCAVLRADERYQSKTQYRFYCR